MKTLTLGISPCPNDVFIFAGLILGEVAAEGLTFQLDYQDVETLNQRTQRGELDLAKISYANYLHCEMQYDLLDCGGALGRGVGPLLLTQGDAFDPACELLVPGEFTTANFLLDFYLQRPIRKKFLPFDVLYETLREVPGAQGVVIHEKRFTYAQDGLTLLQDLGSYWEEKTGYAIPLGAIAVKKEIGMQPELEEAIRRSLRWAYAHYDAAFALCRTHAQDLTEGVIESHIKLYVNEYSEALGTEGQAAVSFFLQQQRRFLAAR